MEMGLQDVRVLLRGYGGEAPTGTAFLDLLGWGPGSGFSAYPSQSSWQGACVELFAVALAELQEFTEPTEEFATRTERELLRAAKWLGSRPAEAIRRWRESGRTADVYVVGWLANEQFDLRFPAAFLAEYGRLGLPLCISAND